jgi:hypothetical protein
MMTAPPSSSLNNQDILRDYYFAGCMKQGNRCAVSGDGSFKDNQGTSAFVIEEGSSNHGRLDLSV